MAQQRELEERVAELEKYELRYKDEPPVTDEDAHNVKLSYEYARKAPGDVRRAPRAAGGAVGRAELQRRTSPAALKPGAARLRQASALLFLRQYPTYAVLLLDLILTLYYWSPI